MYAITNEFTLYVPESSVSTSIHADGELAVMSACMSATLAKVLISDPLARTIVVILSVNDCEVAWAASGNVCQAIC